MGRSIDAYAAFGWIMPEYDCEWKPGHDDCVKDAEYDCWECKHEDDGFWLDDHTKLLDWGFDGSSYNSGECGAIVYLRATETNACWSATPLVQPVLAPDVERTMRDEAERIGVKLPTEPPQWILWPHEG